MSQNRPSELDDLYEQINTYGNSVEYMNLLHFVINHPYMAPYNGALVFIQRPASTFIASARDWQERYGRSIKPGAQPIVIMVPFGPVGFRYDVSQTDGPADFTAEKLLQQAQDKALFENVKMQRLLRHLPALGIKPQPFHFENECYEGVLQTVNWEESMVYKTKKTIYKLRVLFYLRFEQQAMGVRQIGTIMHELGHYFCHHLPNPLAPKDKNGKELYARRHKLSEEQEEFEAESVAWLVCKRLGIPTDSEYYLSHYCTKNGTIPQVSPDAILRAADAIERLMSEDWKDNIWEKLILEKGGNPDYREKVKVPQQTLFRRRA